MRATDLAARLAADAVFWLRRRVMPSEDAAHRRVHHLLKTAAERGMLGPLDSAQLQNDPLPPRSATL
jgi:hypothetical protein